MARVDPERIRNVALLGHSHDGKTSLAEAMLYAGGAVDRLGRPDAGNTTFDFEPEEIKRKISIGTAIAHVTWHDHKINLLDTPGFQDFAGDVYGALRAAESALLVVGAGTGVVVGTELAWQQLRSRELPTLIVVNKMDKENADYWKVVDGFKEFSPRPVSIQAPIGHESGSKGVAEGAIVPVLCSAAGKSIGIGSLLDAIVALLPSPRQAPPVTAVNPRTDQSETLTREPAGPLGAIVFKTTADPFVGRISYV